MALTALATVHKTVNTHLPWTVGNTTITFAKPYSETLCQQTQLTASELHTVPSAGRTRQHTTLSQSFYAAKFYTCNSLRHHRQHQHTSNLPKYLIHIKKRQASLTHTGKISKSTFKYTHKIFTVPAVALSFPQTTAYT
jgi:hypothetical protein